MHQHVLQNNAEGRGSILTASRHVVARARAGSNSRHCHTRKERQCKNTSPITSLVAFTYLPPQASSSNPHVKKTADISQHQISDIQKQTSFLSITMADVSSKTKDASRRTRLTMHTDKRFARPTNPLGPPCRAEKCHLSVGPRPTEHNIPRPQY